MSASTDHSKGIDARGPRFAAGITAFLLLVDVFLGLTGLSTAQLNAQTWELIGGMSGYLALQLGESPWLISYATPLQRFLDPAFLLLLVTALLFLWGVLSPRTAPWGVLYRKVVQPRLKPATEFEDPRPPRFAQGVGLFVVTIGLVLHLLGVPLALPIAAGAAFVAAFLNAAFGLCLGCQMYLVLQRFGLVGREVAAAA